MILATIYFNETEWRKPFVKLFNWNGEIATGYHGFVVGRVIEVHWRPDGTSYPCWQITIDAIGALYVDAIRRGEGDLE